MRARILQRLAGSVPAVDPGAAALKQLGPELARAWFDAPLIPAAVLIPIVERADGLQLLLTRRSAQLRDHPGQVSFPGGRVEAGDLGPLHTALREAREEIGIAAEQVEIVGYLPPHAVVTGFAITPVVGLVAADIQLRLDPVEVAAAFEVPLEFFMDPANRRRSTRRFKGREVPVDEYHYADQRIWGATAQIIDSLNKILI